MTTDLERELRALLQEDSTRAPLVARPPAGLRARVRRRQATSVAGALAIVVSTIAIGGGTWLALREDRSILPVGPRADRLVTVDRFTVPVVDGWWVLDSALLKLLIPTTSETCTFTGQGVPVGGEGVTPAPDAAPSPGGTETCSSEPAEVPAGIPLLQVTRAEPVDLDRTVCGPLEEGRGADADGFRGDDAGLYIAELPNERVGAGWPVPLEPGTGPCGRGLYARFSADGSAYLAFAGFGPDVAPADRDALIGIYTAMQVGAPVGAPPVSGAGVALGAGTIAGERWQVVAGFVVDEATGSVPAAWVVTLDADGSVTGTTVLRSGGEGEAAAEAVPVGDGAVVVALLPDPTVEAAWLTEAGDVTTLSSSVRPGLLSSAGERFEGAVGWAEVPDARGTLRTDP